MVKNSRLVYFFLGLAFLSLSLVSAQTLIAGKIYNADFSNTMEGVNIRVMCNGNPVNTLATDSLWDGTYAVRFEETECKEGDRVVVQASKSGFQAESESGIVNKCEGADCPENYIVIVNLGLKTATSNEGNNGGGGSRFYLCGNGVCDSGETVNTCPKDCKKTEVLTLANTDTTDENSNIESGGEEQVLQPPVENGFFSGITGAVIGVLGSSGGIFVLVFIFALVALAVTIGVVRKRKHKTIYEKVHIGDNVEVLKA